MSQRDERLFPLFRSVETLPKIGPKSAQVLDARGYGRVIDLLMLLPRDGVDRTPIQTVVGQDYPTIVTVPITVAAHQPSRRRDMPYRVLVDDEKTRFQLVFFRANADYIQSQLPVGAKRIVSGSAELYENQVQITHPDYVLKPTDKLPEFEPVYPSIGGISPRILRQAIEHALDLLPALEEWLPSAVLQTVDWAAWKDAVLAIHRPNGPKDLDLRSEDRLRVAFDEILAHQLGLHLGRRDRKRQAGLNYPVNAEQVDIATKALPFELTAGQALAVSQIITDIQSDTRMNRMLQGDVGSGKTAVGFLAMAAMASAGFQSVMMAPTEVLARQHFEELNPWCDKAGLKIACLTGRSSQSERRGIFTALSEGGLAILVGTHAVFQSKVEFANLGLAVIDEQHRFGVAQRKSLGEKGEAVDVLIMTATPIPRSLSLTQYGDMDVSLLTEKPAGRKPIETVVISNDRTDQIIQRLKAALDKGQQAYWVCPLVAESGASEKMAAETRFALLKGALGTDRVGMVHGQMTGEAKETALGAFAKGHTGLLVATTVIEVGVNVPNATIMVVEGAEGFGLSQLHQLRGRVGRSDKASTCVLLYDTPLTETAEARLRALRETNDGFALAELDLQQRGAGDVLGVAQSGLPRFRTAHLDIHGDLLTKANDAAKYILTTDPDLSGQIGKPVKVLLQLMDQEKAMQFLKVG